MRKTRKLLVEQLESRTCPTSVCSANPVYQSECAYLGNLIPASEITISAVQSGNWSDPATWGGRLPGASDNVYIPQGDSVTFDTTAVIKDLLVNGDLSFATALTTSLAVQTFVVGTDIGGVPTGSLEVGTTAAPITGSATVDFAGQISASDTAQLGLGLIDMGSASIVGSAVSDITSPTRTVTFQSAVPGDTTGGHVMFMHTDDVVVEWAAFVNLGRTDKSIPISSTNPRGRYALHFHRDMYPGLTDNDPAILVKGCYESGSPGWGYVNHSSNVDFESDYATNNFGTGFATESGNEIGTFNGCISTNATGVANGATYNVETSRQGNNDWGFVGSGFWFQGPGVNVTNCQATNCQIGFSFYDQGITESGLGAIKFWTQYVDPAYAKLDGKLAPVPAVAIQGFSGDTATNCTDGLNIQEAGDQSYPMPAGLYSVIDGFTASNVTDGVVMGYAGRITVQNSNLTANPTAHGIFKVNGVFKPVGIEANPGYANNINVSNTNVSGFGLGLEVAPRGQAHITGGLWDDAEVFSIPQASAFPGNRLVQFTDIAFGPDCVTDYFLEPLTPQPGYQFVPDNIILPDGSQLYYAQQLAGYVPFPTLTSAIPAAFVGLTNQQLWDTYGLAIEGAIAPPDVTPFANGYAGTTNPQDSYRLLSPQSAKASLPYNLQYQVVHPDGTTGPTVTEQNVVLVLGWNIITRTINGQKHSFLVDGV